MIRAVIVDDEPAAIVSIQELTNQLAKDVSILGDAMNGNLAIQLILDVKPDLIFLDIDLPLMNGLQVLNKLPYPVGEIIFTTGSPDYALQALKLNAVDYLIKPIDPTEFLIAIEKVRKRLGKKTKSIVNAGRVQLPTKYGIIYIPESDITFISGKGSYCEIKTVQDQKITISKSIGFIEEKLSGDVFFRCHNSFIVNLYYVNMFNTKDGSHVVLKDGTKVEVARRSKEYLLIRLAQISK